MRRRLDFEWSEISDGGWGTRNWKYVVYLVDTEGVKVGLAGADMKAIGWWKSRRKRWRLERASPSTRRPDRRP